MVTKPIVVFEFQENPDVALKHDPTKGLQMPPADPNAAARRGEYAGVDMGNNPAAFIAEQQVGSIVL